MDNLTRKALNAIRGARDNCGTWIATAAYFVVLNDLGDINVSSFAAQLNRAVNTERVPTKLQRLVLGHETRVRVSVDTTPALRDRFNEIAKERGMSRSDLFRYMVEGILPIDQDERDEDLNGRSFKYWVDTLNLKGSK